MGSLQNLNREVASAVYSSSTIAARGASPNFNGGLTFPVSHTNLRQSTLGMNLMQSSTASTAVSMAGNIGRNPLFSRERKMNDSLLSPNTFDPTEFPSLSQNTTPNPSLSARPNYVGMVKQPAMETSEFTMSHEDFPALPGSTTNSSSNVNDQHGPPGLGIGGSGAMNTTQGLHQDNTNMGVGNSVSQSSAGGEFSAKKGIQTTSDGMVKNIPSSMVTDQFGMIGLLTFIRAAETDPNLVSLALGADLTTLGLNLNSDVNLYPTFGGPWAETPCRPQDIDFHVPHEYLTNQAIRDKLAPVKLNRYKDDVLFYMFYTYVGDVLQLAAAAELYNRDWRYHREDRVWITRAPGMSPIEKTNTYERGTYYFFDATSWRKVAKEFHLDYDKLEERPTLPQTLGGGGGNAANSSNTNNIGGPPGVGGPHGAHAGHSVMGGALSPTSMPPPNLGAAGVGGEPISRQQQQSPHF